MAIDKVRSRSLQTKVPAFVFEFIEARAHAEGISVGAFARRHILAAYPFKDKLGRPIPPPDGLRVSDPAIDFSPPPSDEQVRQELQRASLRRAKTRKSGAQ